MTVKELREFLANMPDDMPVVMSSDAEGNSLSPLASIYQICYRAVTPWRGELVDADDEAENSQHAIALWPTN